MIIDKVILTEEEQEQLKNAKSEMDIKLIQLKARQRYILSFSKDINVIYTCESIPDGSLPILELSDSNSKKIKQAILSDVHEILKAVTKKDHIEYVQRIASLFSNRRIPFESELPKSFYNEPDYLNCFNFLSGILDNQYKAYDYYRLENLEISKLAEQKAAEWYKPLTSTDSTDSQKRLKKLPKVEKAPTPEKYILPTYKLVDVLFSGELPIGIEIPVNMASEKDNRKGKTAYTLMMLNFDELGDGIKISRELSVYDQQVWNACVNLILNSYKIITPSQIYRWMGYEKQMNDRDKKRIMESVNAIIRARVFIDNENERKLYKNYPAISINTPLLAAKIVTAKSGKNEVTAIEIIEIPDLFAVAEERGQITTIPFEVLEISEIDRTEENLKLLTYLVRRIIHMKHDNDTSRKILLQAIYAKCDIKADERMKRKRLPEKIERIFNHYKKIKWIDGYELTDTEVTVKLPKKK